MSGDRPSPALPISIVRCPADGVVLPGRSLLSSAVGLRDLVYLVYEKSFARRLHGKTPRRHVGVIVDGNRRWAREMGYVDPNDGHRVGAERIKELLRWCDGAS